MVYGESLVEDEVVSWVHFFFPFMRPSSKKGTRYLRLLYREEPRQMQRGKQDQMPLVRYCSKNRAHARSQHNTLQFRPPPEHAP